MRTALGIIALLLAGCATPDLSGTYSGALPATSGGGDERQVRVNLKSGGDASLQAVFLEPRREYFGEGRWLREGDRIVVEVSDGRPQRVVFQRSGQQLVAREWDRTFWGEKSPPVLYRLLRPTITESPP